MYRARELRAKQRQFEKRDGKRRRALKPKKGIGGLCLLVFLLGFLFGRVVLAAEQVMEWGDVPSGWEEEKKEPEGEAEIFVEADLQSDVLQDSKRAEEVPWNLRLVNFEHSLPEDFSVELTQVGDGHQVDSRIAEALKEMIAAGKAEGYGIWIVSSYRTMEKQISLFDKKVAQFQRQGYSWEEARRQAGTMVAVPGTSEHQLGLAVDLVSSEYTGLDERQEETGSYQWLVKHCAEYGFILRYPNNKTEQTGIIYEPWHFRYVGVEAAREIMDQGICLEEYLEQR
ncbi:MAG: M15 family metallopeptidase [Lachnospiraceae bacterium]|nr:M15 family metallopeptidase [Lachnospiraceae bacterium]